MKPHRSTPLPLERPVVEGPLLPIKSVNSPVHALHAQLETSFLGLKTDGDIDRWGRRTRLLTLLAGCVGAWALVFTIIYIF